MQSVFEDITERYVLSALSVGIIQSYHVLQFLVTIHSLEIRYSVHLIIY